MWLEEDFLASLQKQDSQGEEKRSRRQRIPMGPHTRMGMALRTLENRVGPGAQGCSSEKQAWK